MHAACPLLPFQCLRPVLRATHPQPPPSEHPTQRFICTYGCVGLQPREVKGRARGDHSSHCETTRGRWLVINTATHVAIAHPSIASTRGHAIASCARHSLSTPVLSLSALWVHGWSSHGTQREVTLRNLWPLNCNPPCIRWAALLERGELRVLSLCEGVATACSAGCWCHPQSHAQSCRLWKTP
jgi:hypothetical protein